MTSRNSLLGAVLPACAPLPALTIGILAMRHLGLSSATSVVNLTAAALGLVIWSFRRHFPAPTTRGARALLTVAGLAAILLPFATDGMQGVYRWVSVAGLRLHASAIVAPIIMLCVAAAASRGIGKALALSAAGTTILALQPDAAQATSFAAGCAVVLAHSRAGLKQKLLGIGLLGAVSALAFIRPDRLAPVAHVEEIFSVVGARGTGWGALATIALLLLPVPFVAAWLHDRRPISLALGVYIALTVLAPAWGTFPLPVMGYGASPVLGYYIALALALALGRSSEVVEISHQAATQ